MRLLITGGTGYIGSMLIKYILQNRRDTEITAPVRDMDKASRMFPDTVRYCKADLLGGVSEGTPMFPEALGDGYDHIIHCACVTDSKTMATRPVETAASILKVTENVLELARRCKKSGKLRSMVYLSSMEVYGNIDCSDGHRVSEAEYGPIDPQLLSLWEAHGGEPVLFLFSGVWRPCQDRPARPNVWAWRPCL